MGLSEQLATLMRLEEVSSTTKVEMEEVVLVITEWEKIKERDKNTDSFEEMEKKKKKEVEFDGLTKSPAAKDVIPEPMPQVHRVGKDYIVAYSKYDAICHISNAEDKTYKEKEEDYRVECAPLHSHEALFNIEFIGKEFGKLLDKRYPAGVPTGWIEGEAYYLLPFNLVIDHMDTAEPLFLAHLDVINGLPKVFYRCYVGKKVEEYLSGKRE